MANIKKWTVLLLIICLAASGCGRKGGTESGRPEESETGTIGKETAAPAEEDSSGETAALAEEDSSDEMAAHALSPGDKYRTTYEIFVGSYADSNGDGIGDLTGIRETLDYLNDGKMESGTDLGVTGLWTTPVFPSPTYHKYDVSDYTAIDPQFGTMEDFEALLAELHKRGMTWILDLPVNHTSVQHPWFREAVQYLTSLAPDQDPVYEDCPYVWYYRFSQEQYEGYVPLSESGIADDPSGRWFYEARFWSGMPDLNLDTEAVKEELTKIMRFWIDKGIDGFRLDAVTSYYTANKEANIAFLSWLSETARSMKPDIYLVGEAWENQMVYAEYYRSGIDSLFDFGFANAEGIIQKTANGKRSAAAFAEALAEEEALYAGYNPDYVNAPFYTNHDMARSAGFFTRDGEAKVKLAGALNLLMTGNAFVYYGEELGMKGSGKDENKRAPMQWTGSGEHAGKYDYLSKYMCSGPADMDRFAMIYPPFSEQAEDPLSIWNYFRQAIAVRNHYPVIAKGKTVPLAEISDEKICAMIREMRDTEENSASSGEEAGTANRVLIVINTSPEVRTISLVGDAASFKTLGAALSVGEENAKLENGQLTLPGFGIAVLTAETKQ